MLLAGTSIGAGLLALPFTAGLGGFFPGLAAFLFCFLFMMYSMFLLLEASLYCKEPSANIISMSRLHLGIIAESTAWVCTLILFYSICTAYLSGGGGLIKSALSQSMDVNLPLYACIFIYLICIGSFSAAGINWADRINRILMIGLITSYLAMIFVVSPHAHLANLSPGKPMSLLVALPVISAAFAGHPVLPSLRAYLNDDLPSLKKIIIIGSCIPLSMYLVWQFMILSIVPQEGAHGLIAIAKSNNSLEMLSNTLSTDMNIAHVSSLNNSFSFFAIVTSYLGITLALYDFLNDGLKLYKYTYGRTINLALTFFPPLVFSLIVGGFARAISYAGIMVVILYAILPATMVWKARYDSHDKAKLTAWGGKPGLILTVIISFTIIGLHLAGEFNLINPYS